MGKEKYLGVKFKTTYLGPFQPTAFDKKLIKQLINAGKTYAKLGMIDQNGGNISVRTKRGLIIKRTGAWPFQLKPKDFVLISKIKGNQVFVFGDFPPSSEARFHYQIYQVRPDVNCVLHGHDFTALKCQKKFKEIGYVKFISYGTQTLAKATAKQAKNHDYIIQTGHGITALGKDVKTALNLIKKYHAKFCQITKKTA